MGIVLGLGTLVFACGIVGMLHLAEHIWRNQH